jgi:predicted  nucleic acid-binding Zn-ribbon protein
MPKLAAVLSVLFIVFAAQAQTTPHKAAAHNQAAASSDVPSMPSEAEIGELVSKASEYVDTYKRTFNNTRASLDKAPNPGFYEKGMELSEQASVVIAAIRKNGSTAVALVSLLTILDDMSLNAAKASSETMIVALSQDKASRNSHAMQDFQDLAQAGKNCYDISELLFHATIRYISSEETALRTLLDRQKQP